MTERRTRICACGCGTDLDALGFRGQAKWASGACATRWTRSNPGESRRSVGKAYRTRTRDRSGPQLSYRKAVDAVTRLVRRIDPEIAAAPNFVEHVVEAALLDALPVRQRERLEGKR